MAKILVVTTGKTGTIPVGPLESAGHEVIRAASFNEAVTLLAHDSPDLLVTDVQLAAFNGLHLVIRHRHSHPRMGAVVMSPYYDPVLAYEATNCGATYVITSIDRSELMGLVTGLLLDGNPARRWPRKKPIDPLVVRITDRSARVLDLSYEGVRIETSEATELPAPLKIVFPDSGVAIEAQPIWCQPSPVGSWWCGARISGLGQSAQQTWRQLVDAVPASA